MGIMQIISDMAFKQKKMKEEIDTINKFIPERKKTIIPVMVKGYLIDRQNGQLKIDTTNVGYRVNERFYKLNGNQLHVKGSQFKIFYYDKNYELINTVEIEPSLSLVDEVILANPLETFPNAIYIRLEDNQSKDILIISGVDNNNCDGDVVVSSNSIYQAEMYCNNENGTECLQQALWLSYLRNSKVKLKEGDYYLNRLSKHTDKGNKHCLYVLHHIADKQFQNSFKFFTIEGDCNVALGYTNGVRIIEGAELHKSLNKDDSVSLIRGEYQEGAEVRTQGCSGLKLENITVMLQNNDKAITAIDLSYCYAIDLKDVKTMAYLDTFGFDAYNPPPIAHGQCRGIMGCMGSNWNTYNTYRDVEAIGFHIGIAINGEHTFVQNASVKFNWYGFVFGIYQIAAAQFPITCVNLLDEHSVCMPMFGGTGSYHNQMINIFGYNFMFPSWSTQGDISPNDERHKYCVEDGDIENGWGGTIYYVNNTNPRNGGNGVNTDKYHRLFEKGGKNIKCVNGSAKLSATTLERFCMRPEYHQNCFDTTLNKQLVFEGNSWFDMVGTEIKDTIDLNNYKTKKFYMSYNADDTGKTTLIAKTNETDLRSVANIPIRPNKSYTITINGNRTAGSEQFRLATSRCNIVQSEINNGVVLDTKLVDNDTITTYTFTSGANQYWLFGYFSNVGADYDNLTITLKEN